MVRPLPEGLVFPCLPVCPVWFPFVGWRVRLPEGLVSLCTPSCFPLLDGASPSRGSCLPLSPIVPRLVSLCWILLDGVSAFPRVLPPFVSHCAPSCFPLLDGASAFPRVLSPFVSHCNPSCFFCWMVCPPSPGSCLPLSPIVPRLVSLCWMVKALRTRNNTLFGGGTWFSDGPGWFFPEWKIKVVILNQSSHQGQHHHTQRIQYPHCVC